MKESINNEALQYIAGYVAYKFRNKYSLETPVPSFDSLSEPVPDWLCFMSRGGLLKPNTKLFETAKILDCEFIKMRGNGLSEEKRIFKNLAEKTMSKLTSTSIPFEVVLCLSRTRTYIKLRDLNRKISFMNCKRQLNQKMSKFSNKKM